MDREHLITHLTMLLVLQNNQFRGADRRYSPVAAKTRNLEFSKYGHKMEGHELIRCALISAFQIEIPDEVSQHPFLDCRA
jgi:hypothetical protein